MTTIYKNMQKLEEKKIHVINLAKKWAFDAETTKQELDRIKKKITLLKLDRNELQIEEFNLEDFLDFCLY